MTRLVRSCQRSTRSTTPIGAAGHTCGSSAPVRWRRWDRLDTRRRLRPDQQDRAGRVVDDETGLRREAVRPETRAVTVAGADQQIGAARGAHHLVLDPAAAFDG